MTLKDTIEKIAREINEPCVSIAMNTHRTHPENEQDEIVLKNLIKEAEERVVNEFGKRSAADLLEKLNGISEDIDVNYNLDSLHIFASNDTLEVIKTALPVQDNEVHISKTFALRPVIKAMNRSREYLILALTQHGVHLYTAVNDAVTSEVINDDFPFTDIRDYMAHANRSRDTSHADSTIHEFLNKVDKAVIRVHNESHLDCVVIGSEYNYGVLQQAADKAGIYLRHDVIDHHHSSPAQLAGQAWKIVQQHMGEERKTAIEEMMESVSKGAILTDLQEIYQAAIDGRADLLAVHQDFEQAVRMTSERTFELVSDVTQPQVIDDITSNIVWEVLSKKGRVVFIDKDHMHTLGKIALKTRY